MKLTFHAVVLALSLFSMSCSNSPDAEEWSGHLMTSSDLVGEWAVDLIEGAPVLERSSAFLGFSADGRIFGNGSINQLLGSWSFTDDGLVLGKLGSTRMAGPPELMDQESQLLSALERVNTARKEESGKIVLFAADGTPLISASPRAN